MVNKVLVGVSGGPDSMYLLNYLNTRKDTVPIALHVNYHFREESYIDELLVKKYCNENKIELVIFNLNSDNLKKVSYIQNKQAMARKIRYDFFLEQSIKRNINNIYIGHHKDDFIETALMQEKRSKDLLFYGIKDLSNYKNLIIKRPLLNLFKKEILLELEKNNIPFVIDKTNKDLIYERNIIRSNLLNETSEDKNKIFEKFIRSNLSNKITLQIIESNYIEWEKREFEWGFFNKIEDKNKKHLIFKLLTRQEENINISSYKLSAVVEFLKQKNGNKNYRLMENIFMTTKNSKILIQTKNGNRK